MADKSQIEWTDATWGVVVGCDRISSGCASCYAIRGAHRMAGNPNPKISSVYDGLTERQPNGQLDWTGTVRCVESRLEQPLRWREPRRIFVANMGDLFHEDVPDDFILRVFAVMALAPQHTFQVLTKRPKRMAALLGSTATPYALRTRWESVLSHIAWPLPNVWLGTSVEDQQRADERIPHLLKTPASVRFLSCEPLLGPVDLTNALLAPGDGCDACLGHGVVYPFGQPCPACSTARIHWVIAGGESGAKARPCDPEWLRSLRDQCATAGVAYFNKQLGSVWAREHHAHDGHGGEPAEWPPELIVREFPKAAARVAVSA